MLKNSLSFGTKIGPIPVFVTFYESIKMGIFSDFNSILKKKKNNVNFAKNDEDDIRKLKNDFQKRLLISCQVTFPLVLFKEIYDHEFMIFYAVFFSLITFSWIYLSSKSKESEAVVEK